MDATLECGDAKTRRIGFKNQLERHWDGISLWQESRDAGGTFALCGCGSLGSAASESKRDQRRNQAAQETGWSLFELPITYGSEVMGSGNLDGVSA